MLSNTLSSGTSLIQPVLDSGDRIIQDPEILPDSWWASHTEFPENNTRRECLMDNQDTVY
nr:hypothetical protein [uncultured Methanoregula sp.]